MDFLKSYDRRADAERARELHLRDQATGEPILIGDKPALVLVQGAASRAVQALIRAEALEAAQVKAAQAQGDGTATDTNSPEDMHRLICRTAARLIVGFRNLETTDADGTLRPMGVEDADAFLDLTFVSMPHLVADPAATPPVWTRPSFAQQILDFTRNEADFLAAPVAA